MTWVFAHVNGEQLELFSDMQISHGSHAADDVIPGMLKVMVLSPDLCVAYAGPPDLALRHIRAAANASILGGTPNDVAGLLLNAHLTTGGAVEFLIARGETTAPLLQKIANGVVSSGAAQYWIGDALAAERLAALEHTWNDALFAAADAGDSRVRDCFPLLRRRSRDDVLVRTLGTGSTLWLVHFTWRTESDPTWPRIKSFPSLAAFAEFEAE